nr:MAG TPA: hypothetical protein [Caudoviricetes sp.]
MAEGIGGSYFGIAKAGENLIPIFKQNELAKNSNSFLRTAPLVLKRIAIAAPAGTIFTINKTDFLMPANSFELGCGLIDIQELIFKKDVSVTIAYIY